MKTRRDRSSQNVPVVGWQHAADIQDVLLFAAVQRTETGSTDGFGVFKTENRPILDVTHDWVTDAEGVHRERLIDGRDITAFDENDNPLYVGEVDAVEGEITLYVDEQLSQVAANEDVEVSYWIPVQLAVDQEGRMRIALDGPKTGEGNLSVAIREPLPTGENVIGSVEIDGELPEGTKKLGKVELDGAIPAGGNTIGKVELANSEDGPYRIRVGDRDGVGIAALGYHADGRPFPVVPLAVSTVPWLYNGDGTLNRVRNAHRFWSANVESGTSSADLYTGSAAIAILGFVATADHNDYIQFQIGSTVYGPKFYVSPGGPVQIEFANIWLPTYSPGATAKIVTGGVANIGVMAWGTEE